MNPDIVAPLAVAGVVLAVLTTLFAALATENYYKQRCVESIKDKPASEINTVCGRR